MLCLQRVVCLCSVFLCSVCLCIVCLCIVCLCIVCLCSVCICSVCLCSVCLCSVCLSICKPWHQQPGWTIPKNLNRTLWSRWNGAGLTVEATSGWQRWLERPPRGKPCFSTFCSICQTKINQTIKTCKTKPNPKVHFTLSYITIFHDTILLIILHYNYFILFFLLHPTTLYQTKQEMQRGKPNANQTKINQTIP